MPAAVWTINGTALATAGLKFVSGSFRTQGVSTMRLERAENFDATELLAFGATATLARDGTPYFQGKIASIPKAGSASEEFQIYDIADAWEDLDNTVYQEEWALGVSSYLFPRFVFGLGLNALGTAFERITVGAIVRNVIEYAASVGVDLQAGSLPTGEIPIPSEMENTTCAEVIRTALKLHPDWIPWIDHATVPPTFNVTPIASLIPTTLAVDGTGPVASFEVIKRDDLLPDSVRIVYEFATTIDDEVYRNAVIDKWPAAGPDGGPRVIGATIPLAGLQMQIQKSRILTRAIPANAAATTAKAFLQGNCPHLATVDPAHFNVTLLTPTLIDDPDTHPPPINPQAERLGSDTLSDVPRQLVKGQIEDWMRRKIGRVAIKATISAAGGATAPELEAIAKGVSDFSVIATNATTKIYKGISQWIPPEDVPTGIAQSVYQAIHAACAYHGSATITEEDVGSIRYHGTKLNLSGGVAAWATMNAPVHSVDFNVETGTMTIGFGPVPQLAPQDFLEMQRILRFRPVRWWTFEERGSNKLGAETATGDGLPSAAGDTIGGYDGPETQYSPGGSVQDLPFQVHLITGGTAETPTYEVSVSDGWLNERLPGVNDPVTNATAVHKPHNILWGADAVAPDTATTRRTFPIEVDEQVSVVAWVNAEGVITLPLGSTEDGPTKIAVEAEDFKSIHYVPPRPVDSDTGSAGEYHYKLAVLRAADADHDSPWLEMFLAGSHLDHFRELSILDNLAAAATNKGRVFKKYDSETNTYQFRALDATAGELTINELEDGIEIRGNEKDGSLTVTEDGGSPVTVLEWVDGLINQEGATNIDIPAATGIPEGWWGTLGWEWQPASASSPSEYVTLSFVVENGQIKSVLYGLDGGTAVTGTEGTPGSAVLVIQQ